MLSNEEIESRLDEAYQTLFRLRFDWAAGQLQDNNRLTEVKRNIARLKTILREREIIAEYEAAQGEILESEVEA
jgi:large subunit ribosomal protein L29